MLCGTKFRLWHDGFEAEFAPTDLPATFGPDPFADGGRHGANHEACASTEQVTEALENEQEPVAQPVEAIMPKRANAHQPKALLGNTTQAWAGPLSTTKKEALLPVLPGARLGI